MGSFPKYKSYLKPFSFRFPKITTWTMDKKSRNPESEATSNPLQIISGDFHPSQGHSILSQGTTWYDPLLSALQAPHANTS